MSKTYKLNFDKQNFNCLILKRDFKKLKNLGKPEHYLFDIGKKAYVSSLYPAQNQEPKKENIYIIDFKNLGIDKYALVEINQEASKIEVLETSTIKDTFHNHACLDNNTCMVNSFIYPNSKE